jgi:PAS domain S-box-containing protein
VADQKAYLELHVEQVEGLIANLSGVETIIDALDDANSAGDTYTDLATQARIGYILDGYSNLKGLISIDIFTMSGAHYHVGDTLNVSNIRADVKARVFDLALQADHRTVWTGIEDNVNANSSARKVLTAARILRKIDLHAQQPRPIGLLLVNYSVDYLYDYFNQIDLGEGAYLMIVDADNRVIYHPDKRYFGSHVSADVVRKLTGAAGTFTDTIDGQAMLLTYQRSEMREWMVLSFIPVATLLAPTAAIGDTTLLVLAGSFSVVALSAWWISRRMVRPIRQVTHHFKLLQAGMLDQQPRLVAQGRDEIGELVTWFNTFLDNLNLKQQTEAALRASEERYRDLVELSPIPIVVHRDARIIYCNPSAARVLAAEHPKNLVGKSVLDRVHPDDREHVLARVHQLSGGKNVDSNEERFLRLDGHVIDVETFGIAVTYLGEPASLVMFQDISERKQVDRLKSEFVSVVSHELRTPLTAIRGALGLVAGGVTGTLPTQAQAMIEIAHTNSKRLMRLINDILDIEKIESGKLHFDLQPLHLMALVEQALEANHAYAEQFGVSFALTQTVTGALVYADGDRLMQVLANLLSNAAKFSPRGETVQVAVSRRAGSIRLEVRDHGPGIPEAFRGRIFQKFAQADSSDTRQKGGTGLGLNITKAIVERLDGQIGFDTSTGVGTTFYVDLPEWNPSLPIAPAGVAAIVQLTSLPEPAAPS